jgi:hypothetical protein
MSSQELLARLSRLDARDRAWLLGELPAAMRRELATLLSDEPERAAPAVAATPSGWEALDPQRLATVFEAEPAWLVSAATRGTEPRWRDRLLHAMGSRRRHEIELADRSGGTFGARAASCLLEACRERLAAGVEPARDSAPRQGFAALLDQMKERFS